VRSRLPNSAFRHARLTSSSSEERARVRSRCGSAFRCG
jgi:hypothetical protein